MGRRRGFLEQLVHDAQASARATERTRRKAVREREAAARRAERARRAAEQAESRLLRAAAADRKGLEREARRAHVEDMEARAEEQNLQLAEIYAEIDSLLADTLKVDDYVDLDTFRATAQHPPFERLDLERPTPKPPPIEEPPRPTFIGPRARKGLAGLFKKKKHAAAVARAKEAHDQLIAQWNVEIETLPQRRRAADEEYARAEAERVRELEAERDRYAKDCAAREAEVAERNKQLDSLIASLSYGTVEAVHEYISIVVGNSVYPKHFPVTHAFEFDPSSAELRLRVLVPGPGSIPSIKAYKYTKSSDEITSTSLSQKACRDRYTGAVYQVALRSIHEVFEADRRGIIKTVSLEVGACGIDPATGLESYVAFVVVAAEREAFRQFDLSAVVAGLTLERLGATISKNPHGLVPAEASGIRKV